MHCGYVLTPNVPLLGTLIVIGLSWLHIHMAINFHGNISLKDLKHLEGLNFTILGSLYVFFLQENKFGIHFPWNQSILE